ncbi:MAG: bifunctional folylpolyglutamate synthase/dihydrofolate synthase [Actinobacteria bacterium]|nr:MAG: bifunctional folylpolyglutamate synthase/dihydrofolate synthase [Actinomycetota bacterium]
MSARRDTSSPSSVRLRRRSRSRSNLRPETKTASDALAWLDAHVNRESLGVPAGASRRKTNPTLDRIAAIVELLGSPQLQYPVLHLTGTNGKTSVARMATALLVGTGLSTGAYTSPHLERVNERIGWNGVPIDDDALAAALDAVAAVEPFLPGPPSYFEILTAAAYEWFADIAVDGAVVEVGVGGTWDATNVADGSVAVVTNVSIDHVDYLGPTTADIAGEKAGIIKPGATLVLGETDPDLLPIFADRGAARVLRRDVDFGVRANEIAHGGRHLQLFTRAREYADVFLPLHGAHQADNAAVALAAVEAFLERPLDADVVTDAFAAVRSPGRLEVVGHQPLVLLDGAHNVAGAHSLCVALADEFPAAPRTFVVGLLREKEPREMLEALGVNGASRLVCCRAPSPRSHDPSLVAAAARELGVDPDRVDVVDDVADAVRHGIDISSANDQVIVTGSLYVVGAARHALVHSRN